MKKFNLLCGTLLTCMPLCAQAETVGNSSPGAEQAASDNAETRDARDIRDIVVTAQRRAERLADVPVSVNSISQEELQTKHISSLNDLGQSVTSLRFEGQAPQFEPTLRGIGTLVQGGGVDASVAVYLDGVYLPNGAGMGFNLANVSSVQVLKGPQGTLFGRNTTGGAILVTTAEPSFHWTGSVKGTYASYSDGRLEGYVSGPISSNIAVSVSGYYRETPGYMQNVADFNRLDTRAKIFNIRPSILITNNDNFKLRLIYEHSYIFDTTAVTASNPDGYNYAVLAGIPGAVAGSGFPRYAADGPPTNLTTADAFSAIANYQLSATTSIQNVASYRKDSNLFIVDADQSSAPILTVAQYLKFKTFSDEITISHKSGEIDLVAGANYYNSIADTPYTYITTFGTKVVIDSNTIKSEALGLFVDATYQPVNGLFLTLGGRYSLESKDISVEAGGVPPATEDHHRWNAFTPRAIIRYQIDSGDNIYASYNRGFKPGAYAGYPPVLVKPEHVDAFEAGFKHASPLLDFTAAAFYYKYVDFQVTTYDFSTGLGTTINAPGERSYGFEAETTIRPTHNWRISLAGAYLNAKFTDFKDGNKQIKQIAPGFPDGTGQWVPVPQDATGTVVPRSPKWSGNASTTYDLDVGIGKLQFTGNMTFASSLYNIMNEQFRNPAYVEFGLNASFVPVRGHWKAEVFVTNLTDNHRYLQYQGGPFGTYALYAPPRVVGASLAYNF
ncbi:TonB-dependent receptor [Sphingomonas sp. CL5.1]|uniref:TonB-dependent receptor n=1 Tax=Sphingomonas sp. CL5.1 TaxID=2653203 RepID=UPI0015821240|nr:TonB-dependent receptor [Sphingomonas sp. CL5.1]QKS00598.1 TonB-dependent receptor [Sphingomonas sp. CL5.1]